MKNNQNGQSTIEFIFSFVFGVSIVLLVFNSAMNYAAGYLVHYATFMSSRFYLTNESYTGNYGEIVLGNAPNGAKEVFNSYQLGLFGVNAELVVNSARNSTADEYLTVGTWAQFEKQIDAVGRVTGQSTVNLISEAFLGKEPTRAICAARTCFAISGDESGCSIGTDITLFDDGC